MAASRNKARRQSLMAAYCGMAAGLSVVIMLMGGVIPAAAYAVPMLCGLMLLPVLLEFGERAAWATFFSVAALALLLDFDKEAAFFYLFVGYYPIIKWSFDKTRSRPLRVAAKLFFFTISVVIMYSLLGLVFPLEEFMQEFREMGIWMTALLVIIYDISMLLYDRMLVAALMIYANRIRPHFRIFGK